MSQLFIWAIVLAVLAAIALFAGRVVIRKGRDEDDSDFIGGGWVLRGVGAVAGLVAVIMLVFSFTARVGTNKVGVVTSFGKPKTALSNGWHGKSPWDKMVIFDGTRQFLRLDGDRERGEGDDKVFPKVRVRLAGNATADLSGVVSWQMKANTAEEKAQAVQLYRDFRTFDRVRDKYVSAGVQRALGEAFGDFNPLVESQNFSLAELNQKALTAIRAQFGDRLEVISVDLRVPDYDQNTDNAISALQQERQRTETAKQKEETNRAEAKAAAALASQQQVSPSREVLINKCLDIAKEQGKEPGYCFLQGGTPIVGGK